MTSFAFVGPTAQTFVVPTWTNRVSITCVGAAGGRSDTYVRGGVGHGVEGAVVTVTPGATLTVQVGGKGSRTISSGGGWPDAGVVPAPGYGAGGAGGTSGARAGGGSSRVWEGSTLLVVGGGGGGVGQGGSNRGRGGDANFIAGSGSIGASDPGTAGGGGNQTTGGAAGNATISPHLILPENGAYLSGGDGGVTYRHSSSNHAGGGGGGGYYGGGGAASRTTGHTAGGGGGSTWCPWTYTGTLTASTGTSVWGGGTGQDGWVIIDPLEPSFRGGLIVGQPIGVDGLYVS